LRFASTCARAQVNHRCRLNSFELGKWAVLKRSTIVVLNR
jgi:hypothetical protein